MTGIDDVRLAALLTGSYLKLTGRPLAPRTLTGEAAAEWLYDAPFGLLVHDTSPDPLFVYANRTAQRLFSCGRRPLRKRKGDRLCFSMPLAGLEASAADIRSELRRRGFGG